LAARLLAITRANGSTRTGTFWQLKRHCFYSVSITNESGDSEDSVAALQTWGRIGRSKFPWRVLCSVLGLIPYDSLHKHFYA
jgi:hypothetical protein